MDTIFRWLAWKLPTALVTWASVRLIAFATASEKYKNTTVTDLRAMDALKVWMDGNKSKR